MSMIETDPCHALQSAMYATLTADAGLQAIPASGVVKIFDRVSSEIFPFIRIGEDRAVPNDSECGSSTDVYSTVRVYSRAIGKIEAKKIAARVRFLLTKESTSGFAVTGYRMPIGFCEGYSLEEHEDGLTTQAIIEFRYKLNPTGV